MERERALLDSAELEAILASMQLTSEILKQAVLVGQLHRSACTKNDPPGIPGTEAWRWTVRTLRELLIPRGWERSDAGNFSLIVNRKRGLAIAVNTGDEGTGNPDTLPKTKHPKGNATAAAILKNAQQLSLLKLMGEPEDDTESDLITWVLLMANVGGQVRYALFLPTNFKDGRPIGWKERLIFEPIELDPKVDPQGSGEGDAFFVEVERRK